MFHRRAHHLGWRQDEINRVWWSEMRGKRECVVVGDEIGEGGRGSDGAGG
ncbi:hypothetical protein LguiA_000125 [Lonicera macranthoides]